MACTYTIKETGQKLSENEFKAYLLNGGLQSFVDEDIIDIEGSSDLFNKPPKPPKGVSQQQQEDNSNENFLKEFDLRVSNETSANDSKKTLEKMGYPTEYLEVNDTVETLKLQLRKDDATDIINKAKEIWGNDIRVWGKKLYQKALGLEKDAGKILHIVSTQSSG